MKKLLSAACVASLAMTAMLSSCCGNGSCSAEGGDDAVSKAVTDSISMVQGSYIGQAVSAITR